MGRIKGQLTFRALAVGLAVGTLLCFSNTYFGLQTGWVTMGSLQVRALVQACEASEHNRGMDAFPLGRGNSIIQHCR